MCFDNSGPKEAMILHNCDKVKTKVKFIKDYLYLLLRRVRLWVKAAIREQ